MRGSNLCSIQKMRFASTDSNEKFRLQKVWKRLMPLGFSQWHLNRLHDMELLGRFELPTSSLPTVLVASIRCAARLSGTFRSKKDEVVACLFHCFRPLIFPCGSACGSRCKQVLAPGTHSHFESGKFSQFWPEPGTNPAQWVRLKTPFRVHPKQPN